MKRIPPAIRIRNIKPEFASRLGEIAAFFKEEKEDLVFYSALGDGHSISDHLVWLHGMLQHNSKILRKIREEGADIFVDIHSDTRNIVILPNAIQLPHKLCIPTEIRLKK
jgi:hypothetical protein